MLKIINDTKITSYLKNMGEMKPLEIAVIADNCSLMDKDHIVMRTASIYQFEVIDLTKPGPSKCWTGKECHIKVKPLSKNKKITVELFNE